MNIIDQIKKELLNKIEHLFKIDTSKFTNLDITLNVDSNKQQFGDLSCNAALVISHELKLNPREIAQKIKENFVNKFVEKIEIAGPGFINIFFNQDSNVELALSVYKEKEKFFKLEGTEKQLKYSVEFVSANPTGPLHIGHGRNGIIGDVISNLLSFIGHTAIKEFYINDAGLQISKLGNAFKIRCLQLLGEDIKLPEDSYHGEYLIELASEAVKKYGNEIINWDEVKCSHYAKEHLLQLLKETLTKYGIKFDIWFSEKTLHETKAIEKALEILEKNGYLYESEGAIWFRSTTFGDDKDRVVKKNNGEYTYVAPDIAYLQNKIARGFDKLVMILGQDHHSYVIRLKSIMQALGHNPDRLDIILYQLVTLKQSGAVVRMSKRAGRSVTLDDVIDTVGTDVARFFYLNKKADAHLDFDVELALKNTEENPVYYIQYAYVRINSILEKAYKNNELLNIDENDAKYIGSAESLLFKKIASLKYLLSSMAQNYQIHLLTYYVLELSQAFHSYYTANKVIDLENIQLSRARLLTAISVQNTIRICLNILGISAPDKM